MINRVYFFFFICSFDVTHPNCLFLFSLAQGVVAKARHIWLAGPLAMMAPRKRGGRGLSFLCCCLKKNDHPEITYRLRHDSNFTLQTMEPTLPMPPTEELDAMFTELVVCVVPWPTYSFFCFPPFVLFIFQTLNWKDGWVGRWMDGWMG